MNKIVHIIKRDKFTAGYINFMKYDMGMYEHYFILREGEALDLVDYKNIICTKKDYEIIRDKNIKNLLDISDKIIISGFFYYYKVCSLFSKKMMDKTYIHFWGGDFYQFREKSFGLWLKKNVVKRCVRRCKTVLVLIEEDYRQLSDILHMSKKHLVTPMPGSTYKAIDYSTYWLNRRQECVRILVGNSATPENYHLEVFEMLKHLRDENVEIICPLSYGKDEYKGQVMKAGEQIFGDKFIAITNYMSKEDYVDFLSQCTVGVFNNNRQQAMGNISMLVRLGKKVYLKKSTSMWDFFEREGMELWDIELLKNISIEELAERDEVRLKKNAEVKERLILGNVNRWRDVFEES